MIDEINGGVLNWKSKVEEQNKVLIKINFV